MSKTLLLIDIQNDYFAGGSMALAGMDEAAANAARLLAAFRERGHALCHVQHLSLRPGATFFLPGTDGAEIHAAVAPGDGETVVQKNFPNAFRDTGLAATLAQTETRELVICGAMSHMCIDATTRAAFDLGFACQVAADACATRDLAYDGRTLPAHDVHAAFMAALAVPYARVLDTDACVRTLA